MIKRLRTKFVAVAMLSLFTVLVVIMSAVNVLNFRSITNEADSTLLMLSQNEGRFPEKIDRFFDKKEPQPLFEGEQKMSPELPYESRFFSVVVSENGDVISLDTAHIAAVDDARAKTLAAEIAQKGKTKGFSGDYRYLVTLTDDGKRIIFLDCTRDLSTFRDFLLLSLVISFAGLAAVFVLILIFSHRIIRPVSQSYEKQKRFITDAGHEIKTPVTIIAADAEVLEMDIGENEWLTDIRRQAKRLSDLTNDLIFLSKLEESGAVEAIEFPISDIVSETAQAFTLAARAKNITVECGIEKMLSFEGDERAVRQLVSVLLDNAVKYSPQNSTVFVGLKKTAKQIELEVENEAAELTNDDIEKMFDRFYRADPSRSSKVGGYGLGLSIASAVVSAHKGQIAASLSEQRLKITVTLPI